MSSFSIERSRCAAESAFRSRVVSLRSSFFLTPMSLGLIKMTLGLQSQKLYMGLSSLFAQFQTTHFDKILSDFRDTLLALVYCEIRPMKQFVIDLKDPS